MRLDGIHTGIGGKTPIERLRVHNLPVKNN